MKTQNITFDSLNDQRMSEAISFLKAKLYDRAIHLFESVIREDFANSDAYFYAAIAVLRGKRPFIVSTSSIKKAEEYLQTAVSFEPKGIYFYLWAYIKLDYFARKFFKTSPDYSELFSRAKDAGLSSADVKALYDILDIERPTEL